MGESSTGTLGQGRRRENMVEIPFKEAIASSLEEALLSGKDDKDTMEKIKVLKGALATLSKIDMSEVDAPERFEKLRDEVAKYGVVVVEKKFED